MSTSNTDALANWQLGRITPMPDEIPHGWRLVKLTSIAKLESGHTPSKRNPEYWDGDIPWISLHDSDSLDVKEIFETQKKITQLGLDNSSARLLPAGTVVFSRTATVGKSTVMARSMCTSQDFANYICGKDLHNHYLVYLFRFLAPEWERLMAGSTHNSIYMPVFRDLQILLPPLSEQKNIASALHEMDALIDSLDQLIAKKRDIQQAAMQQLLTGQHRLPGFSGAWREGVLSDVVKSLEAGVSVNSTDDPAEPDLPCVLKTSALSSGSFLPNEAKVITPADRERARTNPKRDTILISRMNTPALVGEIAYVENDFAWLFLPDRLWMTEFTSENCVNARWLAYLLSSRRYRRLLQDSATGTSGSMKNISKPALLSVSIRFPAIEEQAAIAAVLSDMDSELAALEARRDKARQLKQGMMQELLTGRIRLV